MSDDELRETPAKSGDEWKKPPDGTRAAEDMHESGHNDRFRFEYPSDALRYEYEGED
jgi:hypothetical protein